MWDVCARGAPTRGCLVKWMARGDSARRIDLVRNSQCLVDCSGTISKVGNTPAAGFRIPKIGDVPACSTTTKDWMAKRMARGDLAHRIGLVRNPQCLVDCSGTISRVVNTPAVGLRIPKTGDVPACGTTTKHCMPKRIARGDSAHQRGARSKV